MPPSLRAFSYFPFFLYVEFLMSSTGWGLAPTRLWRFSPPIRFVGGSFGTDFPSLSPTSVVLALSGCQTWQQSSALLPCFFSARTSLQLASRCPSFFFSSNHRMRVVLMTRGPTSPFFSPPMVVIQPSISVCSVGTFFQGLLFSFCSQHCPRSRPESPHAVFPGY